MKYNSIKHIFSYFKTNYAHSLIILMSGTFAAQFVPIVFYPIVSRLFTPEQFGSVSIFSQISSILAVFAAGGYTYSIFIAKKKKEALNLFALVIFLSFCTLFIVFICFFILRKELALVFKEKLLERLYFIPTIMAFCIIIYQCYNEWSIRNKSFKQLSCNKIINSSAISVSETLVGLKVPALCGNGLIIGQLAGRAISALSCLISIIYKNKYLFKFIQFRFVSKLFKKYDTFPKYIMTGKLLNAISCAVPIFYLAAIYSKDQLGYFSMANTILAIPTSVISLAAGDAFRQKANSAYLSSGSCRKLLVQTATPFAILSIAGFSLLFILAPSLFEFVLGNNWRLAGVFARYLIPMIAISFFTGIFDSVLIIANRNKYDFIWQILFLCGMLLLVCIDLQIRSIYIFLILFSLLKSVLFILRFHWCYKFSKFSEF